MTDELNPEVEPDGAEPDDAEPAPPSRRRGSRWVALAAALIALLAAGLIGRASARQPTPGDGSADAGFARDMQVHHAQAVRMAMVIRDKTDDAPLRTLAYDIALGQQQQIGQLHGWLTQWGRTPTSTRPMMAWMSKASHGGGHDGASAGNHLLPDGRMPGMATRADLDRLAASTGRTAEVLFLRLMIAHHKGGVAMARAGAELAERPEVRNLATSIATVQAGEVTVLTDMLKQRGLSA